MTLAEKKEVIAIADENPTLVREDSWDSLHLRMALQNSLEKETLSKKADSESSNFSKDFFAPDDITPDRRMEMDYETREAQVIVEETVVRNGKTVKTTTVHESKTPRIFVKPNHVKD